MMIYGCLFEGHVPAAIVSERLLLSSLLSFSYANVSTNR